MQLVSTNLPGNLHAASDLINVMGLAAYVITLKSTGYNSIAVFRCSDEMAPKLRAYFNVMPDYLENKKPERNWED